MHQQQLLSENVQQALLHRYSFLLILICRRFDNPCYHYQDKAQMKYEPDRLQNIYIQLFTNKYFLNLAIT